MEIITENKYKIAGIIFIAAVIYAGTSIYNSQQAYKDQQPRIEQTIADTLAENIGTIRGFEANFYPAALILRWPTSFEFQGSFAPPIPKDLIQTVKTSGKPRDQLRPRMTGVIDMRNNTLEILVMGKGYELGENYSFEFDPQPYIGQTYELIQRQEDQ